MNEYLNLFGTFAKVGVMTFGGGYAMLPILSGRWWSIRAGLQRRN